jgi:TonB dependent receptor/TonB-dependent Receptor Plug Domain/CarboxypepD_reg-like domain
MRRLIFIFICLFIYSLSYSQQFSLSGIVSDSISRFPLAGATVVMAETNRSVMTDEEGKFIFRGLSGSVHRILISAVGFQRTSLDLSCTGTQTIPLCRKKTNLMDVVVTAFSNNPYKSLMENDIEIRGVANAQEVLRMVPGLFIGQHQGGGKAEQIFLRGFDADHGTDLNVQADGMPVNMVSHAHGQGYADSHFIIPETIEKASFNKGPYEAQKGDFATAGYLEFHTFDAIRENMVAIEAGEYSTYRVMTMMNLLPNDALSSHTSWYAASEYFFTNSYFDNPEHFKRFNLFTKFVSPLNAKNMLSVSLSTFWTSWYASGQIPERAVDSGIVGYFSALDPAEGGVTSRTNVNLQLRSSLRGGDFLKNQLYYSNYHFDLHSNFSFFMVDTLNGDEIRQREERNIAGYNGVYTHDLTWQGMQISSQAGVNIRMDWTKNTGLEHTLDRYVFLNQIKLGNITEFGTGFFLNETLRLNEKWHINAGVRFDAFSYQYDNLYSGDTTLPGLGFYRKQDRIASPKLSVYYQANTKTELYISLGKGFHTNDARVVVAASSGQTLPAAYASDLGFIYKPFRNVFLQSAFWYIYLQQEFVYGGDGGTIDFSGKTKRYGFDFSGRYQINSNFFMDLDINFAHGRSVDAKEGQNFIPLAPIWSSTAGIRYSGKTGLNLSLRYRYLSPRPANEDNSLVCQGYFVNDLVMNYRHKNLQYGLIVNNIFNVRWRETQFDTWTQLKGEKAPADGISFTPGTKLAVKLSMSFYFN